MQSLTLILQKDNRPYEESINCTKVKIVTSNTRGGNTRISVPLWARIQDAFLVVHRLRDRAQLATHWLFVKGFGNL